MNNKAERFIAIEGSINLRDFGGYTTADGNSVKRGLLFRCGAMSGIAEHAFDDFATLDIGVICDLRRDDEAAAAPTPTVAPFDCRVHIPIAPGSSARIQTRFQKRPPIRASDSEEFIFFMTEITRELARDNIDAYRQLLAELLQTDRGFLLHCSAGKDRTGFGVAIILSLLGVPRESIFHDYLISNEATELARQVGAHLQERLGHEVDADIIAILSGVRKEYLHAAFDVVDNDYDGIDGYAYSLDIGPKETQHLRARLLEVG